MAKDKPTEPVYSTVQSIANGKFSVTNLFTNQVQRGVTKQEANALKRKWDDALRLPREVAQLGGQRAQRVDEDGNPIPTKTEIIIDCLMQGMSYKETAQAARCRYQMAHNIGTKFFKANPAKLKERERAVALRSEKIPDAI